MKKLQTVDDLEEDCSISTELANSHADNRELCKALKCYLTDKTNVRNWNKKIANSLSRSSLSGRQVEDFSCHSVTLTHRPLVSHISGRWTWSALVQIMACRLDGAKPLSEPMLTLSIRPQGTYFNEFLFEIQIFSFKKMHLNMSSAKWRPFCPRGDELNEIGID